jgi:hypothetical protein
MLLTPGAKIFFSRLNFCFKSAFSDFELNFNYPLLCHFFDQTPKSGHLRIMNALLVLHHHYLGDSFVIDRGYQIEVKTS